MNAAEVIEKAVEVLGSQRTLAKAVGIREQHISDFKRGRAISPQKLAEIAAAAGMHEEARRIILQGFADTLRDDIPHEAEAKAGFLAMLKAFPKSLFNDLLRIQILAKNGPFCTGAGGYWMLQA